MSEINDKALLAARLKEMREYLSLSQEEVSQAVGIPRSAISLIESGDRRVDALELKRFAEVYQCPIEHLTGPPKDIPGSTSEIQFLAKAAAKLTNKDLEELVRFAEFLRMKNNSSKK